MKYRRNKMTETKKVTLTLGQLRKLVTESKDGMKIRRAIDEFRESAYDKVGTVLENLEDESIKRDLIKVFKREVEQIFSDLYEQASGI